MFDLYRRLGYVRTHQHFIDANLGFKYSMVWCLRDREGMRRVGSPIAAVVAQCEDDREGREWLQTSVITAPEASAQEPTELTHDA